jgi:hypothetical protein
MKPKPVAGASAVPIAERELVSTLGGNPPESGEPDWIFFVRDATEIQAVSSFGRFVVRCHFY